MDFPALWKKLKDKESPFRTGWAWIVTGLIVALAGAAPLICYLGIQNLTGSSGGNPIGLGLLTMLGFGLSQLCLLVALIWMAYGIFQVLNSFTS